MERPRDCQWQVDGLTLHGLEWGPSEGMPMLALHGWMDHADSFAELAPRLTGHRVIALDLSGQGLSGHRAAHATYNIWDDLPQIAGLMDLLGWSSCTLLGHSRGANISTLFAAAQPERVRALIALDSLIPQSMPEDSVVRTLRAFIEESRASLSRPPRTFPSREAYVTRRREQGNSPRTSEVLAPRALQDTPEGVRLRGDPRMFASSAVKFTEGQLDTVLKSLQCPVLNIWASRGISKSTTRRLDVSGYGGLVPDYTAIEIDGDHHFHLDPTGAREIAAAVLDFLDRNAPQINVLDS